MKIVLNYDEITGQVTDNNGMLIFTYIGLQNNKLEEISNKKIDSAVIKKLIELQGMNVSDIIELSSRGLL